MTSPHMNESPRIYHACLNMVHGTYDSCTVVQSGVPRCKVEASHCMVFYLSHGPRFMSYEQLESLP